MNVLRTLTRVFIGPEELDRTVAFYEAIGMTQDPAFPSGENGAAMQWGDAVCFMLTSHAAFGGITQDIGNNIAGFMIQAANASAGQDLRTNGGLEAMRRLFGAAGHDITISNNVPALGPLPATIITRSYTQLKEIGEDVDDARVYGGIHWRYDQDAGNVLGRAIATEVVKNNLRPVHPN